MMGTEIVCGYPVFPESARARKNGNEANPGSGETPQASLKSKGISRSVKSGTQRKCSQFFFYFDGPSLNCSTTWLSKERRLPNSTAIRCAKTWRVGVHVLKLERRLYLTVGQVYVY